MKPIWLTFLEIQGLLKKLLKSKQTIWTWESGQNPQTFMIPIDSTTVLYDTSYIQFQNVRHHCLEISYRAVTIHFTSVMLH